jgi:hypothetical protein
LQRKVNVIPGKYQIRLTIFGSIADKMTKPITAMHFSLKRTLEKEKTGDKAGSLTTLQQARIICV